MLKMTDALEEALQNCPVDKWFTWLNVIGKIRRTQYQLDRLVKAGKLEERIVGSITNLFVEYRKL